MPTRTPRDVRPWLAAAFTERLPTKLAALVLAIVVWAVVRGEEPTELVYTARVVTISEGGLEVVSVAPETVEVAVTGSKRELLKLRSQPPVVRRRVDEREPRQLRITLQPADVEFPLGVEATAREVRPRTVLVTLRAPVPPDAPR